MAERLARIIGTEEDRVNCPFYWKIGACRHGDQCSRAHYKPTASQTLVLRHMYQNPPAAIAIAEGQPVDDAVADQAQDNFEEFFEEVFTELAKYGEVEEMVVCDNIGDHMIGNVYVKYVNEDDATTANKKLQGRFYAGRAIECEFCPVTDFREARCRQFVEGQCTRGGYCNFMHTKHVPRSLKRKLFRAMYDDHPEYRDNKDTSRSRSRSRSRDKDRDRSRDRDRGGGGRDRDSRDGDDRRDARDRAGRDKDRDRDRDRPRSGERGDARRRYSPEGDRRQGGGDRDRPRGDSDRDRARQSSEERRNMIASWNKEKEGANGSDRPRSPPRGDPRSDRDKARQPSEERRAMIARWNTEGGQQ